MAIKMKKECKQIEKWNTTLESITTEISYLANIDDIYNQLLAIMRTHPELRKGGHFHSWLQNTYITTLMVGIRRLTDTRKDSDSLKRLLLDVKKNLRCLTQNRDTDGYGRKITQRLIDEKINKLTSESDQVIKITNDFLTHKKKNPKAIRFRYSELRRILATIFSTYKWCRMTISRKTPLSPVPVMQGNWLEIFRYPWLPEGQDAPSYKKLDDFI